jgi:hypothetical protein
MTADGGADDPEVDAGAQRWGGPINALRPREYRLF